MRVLLTASDTEDLAEYLRKAGHGIKELYANDLAVQTARQLNAEVVVYLENHEAVVSHEEVMKALIDAGMRVVLVTRRDSPLVPFAGALGIRDFVFLPADPAQIHYRLDNPATPLEAAEMVRGLSIAEHIPKSVNLKEAGIKHDEMAEEELVGTKHSRRVKPTPKRDEHNHTFVNYIKSHINAGRVVIHRVLKKQIPLPVTLILAVASAVLVYTYSHVTRPIVPVVVATQNILAGQELTKENVTLKKVPGEAVPPTAIRFDALTDKTIATGPVLAGDIVRTEHVSPAGTLINALRADAPQGWVAVELPPDTALGMAGIKKGDIVDVYAEIPSGQDTMTDVAARDAVVLSTPWDTDGKGKLYVIAVRPEEVRILASLTVKGKRAAIVLK